MASINEELAALPKQRLVNADVKGLILFLPRTGLTVVPVSWRGVGSWQCVVVHSDPTDVRQKAYPVGGYDLAVSAEELATGVVIDLDFGAGRL